MEKFKIVCLSCGSENTEVTATIELTAYVWCKDCGAKEED